MATVMEAYFAWVGGYRLEIFPERVNGELALPAFGVPARATGQPHAGPMSENEDRKPLGPGWEHLFARDRRTEEEQKAAEAKESARRRGRGNKDWWKKYLPPEQGE